MIRQHVWRPVAEPGTPAFALEAPRFGIVESAPELRGVAGLGLGGRHYGSGVPGRAVTVMQDRGGLTVIAGKRSGGAGPPNPDAYHGMAVVSRFSRIASRRLFSH